MAFATPLVSNETDAPDPPRISLMLALCVPNRAAYLNCGSRVESKSTPSARYKPRITREVENLTAPRCKSQRPAHGCDAIQICDLCGAAHVVANTPDADRLPTNT